MIHIKRIDEKVGQNQNLTPLQQEVMTKLEECGIDTSCIIWTTDHTFYNENDGSDGCIYRSEEEARKSILRPNGEHYQIAIDCVNGAQSDDEWVDYLENGGVKRKTAEKIISSQNWKKVVEIIVKSDGGEWFLSSYSGDVYELSNGYFLYY